MADQNTQTNTDSAEKSPGLFDLLLGSSAKKESAASEDKKASGGLMDSLLGPAPKKKEKKSDEPDDGISDDAVKSAEEQYQAGLQKVLDIIAPSGVEIGFKNIKLGSDMICRSFFVYNWPSQIHINWLSPIINLDARMEISQFIYPTSNETVMKMLKRKTTEMRATMRMKAEKGFSRDPEMEAALQDAEQLRDMLARGHEKLFQFGMYLTIYAETEEKLKKIQGDIESILGGKLVLTKPADFQMEHGWNSTLPICLDELEINRNMNTAPLATTFPFTSSDLSSDEGILYGINRHNESLVIFDRFKLPNANSTVFATSGAGKSYAVKLEVIRYLMMDTEVFIIDPENEYKELADVVGGTTVPLSIQSQFRINPFDLPRPTKKDAETSAGELLRTAVLNLHGLFKLMLKNVTAEQESILDKAIMDTYALKGITVQSEEPGSMEPPILDDLVDVLRTTEGGEDMAKILEKFTTGSFSGIFNKPTNINTGSQLMVFQTRDLEDEIRPMAIYIVLNFLWNEVRSTLKKRMIVMDEAWNIMQYEDSARFLYGLIKRARKYFLGITTITQDVEDFMRSPYGKPIVTNAAMQVLLKQAPSAIPILKETFNLTEGEKYLLLNSGVGQGVFFAGRKHVAIQIVASPKEHEIVTTNPEEIAKRRADKALAKQEKEKAESLASTEESTKVEKVADASNAPDKTSDEAKDDSTDEKSEAVEEKKPESEEQKTEETKKESLFPEPPKEEKKEEES